MPHEKPLPKCKALLLCDQCIFEAGSGKPSLIGVFDGFWCQQLPGFAQPFTVFVQLIEGIGQYAISLQVHDLQNDQLMAETAVATIRFQDRLNRINLTFPIVGLPIGHAGTFDFRVLANHQLLEQQTFTANLAPPQTPIAD